MTQVVDGSDKPNGNQLYPMYSVLEFEHSDGQNVSAINVKMCRVAGIFKEDGKDSFTQTSYGNRDLSIHYLIEMNETNASKLASLRENTAISPDNYMYGAWVTDGEYTSQSLNGFNKYLYIQY
jgi:hypothetical protein